MRACDPVAITTFRRGIIPGSLKQVASRKPTVAANKAIEEKGNSTVGLNGQLRSN
jgi:hypothetical protein